MKFVLKFFHDPFLMVKLFYNIVVFLINLINNHSYIFIAFAPIRIINVFLCNVHEINHLYFFLTLNQTCISKIKPHFFFSFKTHIRELQNHVQRLLLFCFWAQGLIAIKVTVSGAHIWHCPFGSQSLCLSKFWSIASFLLHV